LTSERTTLPFGAMLLDFTKMNGAGNDFVLLDNRSGKLKLTREQIVHLCDRHRGIGADGVILLTQPRGEDADWAWEFYNSDGSTGEMCGNGARCFARFVQKLTRHEGDFTFETEAGIIQAQFRGERVTVNLTRPTDLRLDEQLALSAGKLTVHSINTGVPHAVLYVLDADKAMVQQLGPEIRRHARFAPKGTNVNFVQVLETGRVRVRTFERGVEGETLACGTGVAASALVTSRVYRFSSPIRVQVQGGDELEVSFVEKEGHYSEVCLTGPADFAFEGKVHL
jgi:diaminopimelate epimerase